MWRRGEPEAESEVEPVRNDREARMAGDGEVTVVGPGARLEGTVVSAGSLRIDGTVKGQVNADGDVMLSPQSQVEADIRAENVTVAGKFTGNIIVKGKAELARGGRIDGNVTSKVLVIQEGGVFCGESIMDEQAQKAQQAQAQGQGQAPQAPQAPPPPGASSPGRPTSQDTSPSHQQPDRAKVP
jgi:cytoskeletal protein CcmA (bactofilin family)